MLPFTIELKKTYFGPILESFCPNFCLVFSLYDAVVSCKKWEKLNISICYNNQKTHFGLTFIQKLQFKIFLKKNHLAQGFMLL